MTVTDELRAAAALLAKQAPEATFHRRVGQLLDHLARTTPDTVIESQAGPLVRFGLDIARAYLDPGRDSTARALAGHLVAEHAVIEVLPYEQALRVHARDQRGGLFVHDRPAHLHAAAKVGAR